MTNYTEFAEKVREAYEYDLAHMGKSHVSVYNGGGYVTSRVVLDTFHDRLSITRDVIRGMTSLHEKFHLCLVRDGAIIAEIKSEGYNDRNS